MAKVKVRCLDCGAVNSDALATRCRVCSSMLPDMNKRQAAQLGATEGPAFAVLVENEVAAWQEYAEGRNRPGAKTRRPTELDDAAPSRLPWRRKS